jgi:membrane protease YdiL (CAAX protease family)
VVDLAALRFELLVWLSLTVLGGGLAAALWCFAPGLRRLLPPQRRRAVPWTGPEFVIFLFLVYCWPVFVYDLLSRSGFFTHIYGEQVRLSTPENGPAAQMHDDSAAQARVRQFLWATLFAFPLQVVTGPLFLRLASGTRPYQLGLTARGVSRNVLAGFLGGFILTPLVNAVHALVVWGYWSLLGIGPEEHPLTRLTRQQSLGVEWLLLIFSAVVAAPVIEELLFRGVLQPWLARRAWGGDAALAVALAIAVLGRWDPIVASLQGRELRALVRELQPALFTLAMILIYWWVRRRGPAPVFGAIYGTALLFALSHLFAWPTPIPLFVLGLGLGWLAYRFQSPVSSMVLHALFNGAACLMLFLAHETPPPPPARGNETISAVRLSGPVTTSSFVPGSWLPRRT